MFVKIKESTPPKINCNVNYRLWVIMMCRCVFISFKKCITLVKDVDNGGAGHEDGRKHMENLYLPLKIAVKLKLL